MANNVLDKSATSIFREECFETLWTDPPTSPLSCYPSPSSTLSCIPLQHCSHSVHRNAGNKHFGLTDTADRDLEASVYLQLPHPRHLEALSSIHNRRKHNNVVRTEPHNKAENIRFLKQSKRRPIGL